MSDEHPRALIWPPRREGLQTSTVGAQVLKSEFLEMSKKLTDKQKKFCEEYIVDLNATQAAIRAKYSPKTAQRIGSENLSKPLIDKEIQRLQAKLREQAHEKGKIATPEEIL